MLLYIFQSSINHFFHSSPSINLCLTPVLTCHPSLLFPSLLVLISLTLNMSSSSWEITIRQTEKGRTEKRMCVYVGYALLACAQARQQQLEGMQGRLQHRQTDTHESKSIFTLFPSVSSLTHLPHIHTHTYTHTYAELFLDRAAREPVGKKKERFTPTEFDR